MAENQAVLLFRQTEFRPATMRRSSVLLVGAVVAIGTASILVISRSSRVAPAAMPIRTLEPRLSGFAWAPLRSPLRGEGDASNFRLASTVASALASTDSGKTANVRYANGVMQLLAGRTREALSSIAAAAESSNDPWIWNDYAAACHAAAERYDAPELLTDALTAADTALTFDPQFPEALYNRALLIEHLGLREQALNAWQRYLAVDNGSEWSGEARQHTQRLAPELQFQEILERDYESLSANATEAAALARRFPQQARTFGEARILARWAVAEKGTDRTAAERHLRLARSLGTEVKRINGDAMLEQGVAAIVAADDQQRRALASAHLDLSAGHDAFNATRYLEAETKFRAAAANFERGRSPIALVARYYTANAVFEQGRPLDARKTLEPLSATVPSAFPALRAQILWEIGLCHASAAHWGEMLRAQLESIAMFERLGETGHAAILHNGVAAVYDRIGDRESAWKHRVAALRFLGRHTTFRLQHALYGIGQAAMLEQKWRTAASFLNLEVEIGRRVGNEIASADGLLVRAAVRHRLQDSASARADLAEAGAIISAMKDAAAQARINAKYAAVQAMVEASPAEAISLLTQAIDYQATKGYRMFLPGLFLQAARAHRAGGDLAGAERDVERGIAELETHRESLPRGDARWGVFLAADELFEEGIALALLRGDTGSAFDIVERARARSLLDVYGRAPSVDTTQLPTDAIVVEYAMLPSRLVIFTAGAAGVSAMDVPCDRTTLATEADAFIRALRNDDRQSARMAGTALYRRLVEPIAEKLTTVTNVVFVADGALATIPFGALVDPAGHYLLERHPITVAPSASVFAAAAERRRAGAAPERVLIVTRSAEAAGSESLAFVEHEADEIARVYPTAVHLKDDDARLETLASEGATSSTVHFAGHAVGDAAGLEPASIVLSDEHGRERRVRVPEIASLSFARASVVVLAGCSTAVGERRSAEGALSVARGFLAAGAPSVIATLWPIDDREAAGFFPRLHARLAVGIPPAEALRTTQLEMMRQPDASVAMWAAVQNIGS